MEGLCAHSQGEARRNEESAMADKAKRALTVGEAEALGGDGWGIGCSAQQLLADTAPRAAFRYVRKAKMYQLRAFRFSTEYWRALRDTLNVLGEAR